MYDVASSVSLSPLRILLLGYGNVAQALLPLLSSRSQWLGTQFGVYPLISGIGTRRSGFYISSDGIGVDAVTLAHADNFYHYLIESGTRVNNAADFIVKGKDAGASLLIELTSLNPQDGEPARSHIQSALQLGMDVITANKGPVAHAQTELQALASRHNVQFRFESTVMDGLPLINLKEFTLQGVGILGFRALLNMTSNLVLDLIVNGYKKNEAIHKAQEMGIAEADPWYDLDGWDAVMKTTILANTLLDAHITPQQVGREGIRNLTFKYIRAMALQGTPVRLVAQASRKHNIVVAQVRPEAITRDDILHVGKGTTSVISLETELMGTITLVEHEPVVMQTAYGTFSDLITIVRNRQGK